MTFDSNPQTSLLTDTTPPPAVLAGCGDTEENIRVEVGPYLGWVATIEGVKMVRYDLWVLSTDGYTGYVGVKVGDPASMEEVITGELACGYGCPCGCLMPEDDMYNLVRSVENPMHGSRVAVSMSQGVPDVSFGMQGIRFSHETYAD